MQKTILKFGLISGFLCSLMIVAATPLEKNAGFDNGYYFGYTVIVLSFLLVFFGIRSYRENVGGGQITFLKGLAVGGSIMLITCAFYVATWEVIYFNFMHDFMDRYGAYLIDKARTSGASAAALQAKMQEVQKMKVMYENPIYNVALTFMEPFPVGLVITLISALTLRKTGKSATEALASPAASVRL